MSDRRGQATTIVVGAIILSLLLSMLVGGGLSLDGTTNDFNLNEASNNGDRVPSISYAAVCFFGDVGQDYGLDTVDITFSNEGDEGEYFNVSYTADYGADFIIVKGGQRMEMFPPDAGPYTFGTGELVNPAYDNDAPCGPSAFGVRVNVDSGEKDLVGDGPVFVATN